MNTAFPSILISGDSSTSNGPRDQDVIEPTISTVVIGKGGVPRQAPGNGNLRELVTDKIKVYYSSSRIIKSSIVSDIYYTIQELCRKEGNPYPFVRYDPKNGTYCEISEANAREKITATFRDNLHDKYRSSSKNKCERRRQLAKKTKAEKNQQREQEYLRKALNFLENNLLPMRNTMPSSLQQQVPFVPSWQVQQQQQQQQQSPPSQQQPPCQQPLQQQQQQQQQSPQQQAFDAIKKSSSLDQTLCNMWCCRKPMIQRSSSLLAMTTKPLVDLFSMEDIEPLPIPELDCASSCSSTSSHPASVGLGEDDANGIGAFDW